MDFSVPGLHPHAFQLSLHLRCSSPLIIFMVLLCTCSNRSIREYKMLPPQCSVQNKNNLLGHAGDAPLMQTINTAGHIGYRNTPLARSQLVISQEAVVFPAKPSSYKDTFPVFFGIGKYSYTDACVFSTGAATCQALYPVLDPSLQERHSGARECSEENRAGGGSRDQVICGAAEAAGAALPGSKEALRRSYYSLQLPKRSL